MTLINPGLGITTLDLPVSWGVTNVTPFTYRDGLTYQQVLEALRKYITQTLVPELTAILIAQNAHIDEVVIDLTAYVDAAVASIIGDSVEVQDPVVAGIVADIDSDTRTALDALYAPKSVQTTVESGRLSQAELDADYAAKALVDPGGRLGSAELDARYARKGSVVVLAAEYGVVADGVTVNTTNLQAALSAAGTGALIQSAIVQLPAGTIVTDGVTIPPNVATLRGQGRGNTILKQTGAPTWLVRAAGTIALATTQLTVNAVKGATQLTVLSTAGLVANDLFALHDEFAYNPLDVGYKSGEMLRVKTIDSGTTLTVYGMVRGSWASEAGTYTTANATKLSKITRQSSVNLSDLSFSGDPATITGMFLAQYCDGVTVENVGVIQGGAVGLRFDGCKDTTVINAKVRDLVDDVATNHAGYGIVASGPTENFTVIGGNISKVRHGFTTMGGQFGFPHGVTVEGLTVTDCTLTGIDTHAAGEGILITGNTVSSCVGGISFRSRKTTVRNNHISGIPSGHGISLNESHIRDAVVTDNTIIDILGGSHGIASGDKGINVTIKDNTLLRIGADGIYIDASSENVVIEGNITRNVGMALATRAHIRPGSTAGTPATSGWSFLNNTCIQDAGIGSARRAVSALDGGLTGALTHRNTCSGTFTDTPFNISSAGSSRNIKIDDPKRIVTGSRDGNVAVANLLSALHADGYVDNQTTA